jgi:hypothetical protein
MKNKPKAIRLFKAFSIILFIATLLQTMPSYGRKFYFSSTTGNDNNTVAQAQNPATPWRSLRRLQNFGNSGLAAAGDTFAFRCGEVFSNGRDEFGSLKWWSINGFRCPSGTARDPIVFTSYGTGAKPNFLFPTPAITIGRNRIVMAFDGVNYIVLNGLQFSDNRFPVNDKVGTALTSMGILLGEDGIDSKTNHSVIKNCLFNNIGSGISMSGNNNRIENNVFTNFKNYGDTSGNTDVGAIPIILMSGKYNRVTNNYIQGGWAYTAATASGAGLNGVGIEIMNDFDSSFIGYNTIIDCAGGMEIGNNTRNAAIGANEDTIAYNIFINNGVMCYGATSGTFSSNASKIRFWNNVYVENENSRFSGPRFGQDIFSDGQSFTNFPSWPAFPQNSSTSNFGGFRILQYPFDSGNPLDTLFDSRNNVFWMTNRNQAIYGPERVRSKRANNLYHIVGQAVLGGVLNGGDQLEINTQERIFLDTLPLNPRNWNFNIDAVSPAFEFGRNVGLSIDFFNNRMLGNPDAGIHELQRLAVNVQTSVAPISCFGDSTTIVVTANGGVPPFTGTGNFIRSAGPNLFTVTDAVGTSKTITVNVQQPARIQFSTVFNRILEFGGSTSITINASGGKAPYQYSLNGGQFISGNQFPGISAGSYLITVRDSNLCTQSANITINQPSAPFVVQSSIDSIRCKGGQATIRITATGGTPPYVGTGSFLRRVGTSNFSVRDSNGVLRTISIVLSEPDTLLLTSIFTPISVFGGNTTVTLSGSGGRRPYRYSWNNGAYQTNNTINGVIAGSYRIAVMDTIGCITSRTISITQPSLTPISASASSLPIICRGGITTVTIRASGGLPPYVGTGNFVRTAGTHTFLVTDAAGQSQSLSITLTEPAALSATLSSGTITVIGGTTSITVNNVSGGRLPYRYSLNGGTFQSGNVFSEVPAGIHHVVVRDSLGCTLTRGINIKQPLQISIISVTNNQCRWISDGSITVGGLGGTPPYVYRINNFGYGTNNVFSRLAAGTYTCFVRDSSLLVSSISVTILASRVICSTLKSNQTTTEQKETNFFLFPNPSRNGFQIANVEKSGLAEVDIYSVNGVRLANYSMKQTTMYFGTQLKPGMYFIRGIKKDRSLTGFIKWVKLP